MLFGIANTLVFILATMSLGYFVCVKAAKEQGFLKILGLVIGAIIIVSTLLFSIGIIGLSMQSRPAGMMRQQSPTGARPMMPQQQPQQQQMMPKK